jgi:WD40 repeat protein
MYSNTKKWIFTLCSIVTLLLLIYLWPKALNSSSSVVVSIAADGNYALSSHTNGNIILWDVKAKKSRLIAKNSNPNSVYFIKNGNNFLWQDVQSKRIHVQNTLATGIFSFHLDYAVQSVAMTTDLSHLYATDKDWNLYSQQGEKVKILKKGELSSVNLGKALLVSLSFADKFLVTTGAGVVQLWNREEELVRQFSGLMGKVVAASSPDNKYIVTGDEMGQISVWDIVNNKEVFKLPKTEGTEIIAIKFIDLLGNYLCFFKNTPYAFLYNINNSQPIKSINLGRKPETVDTAPQAQILVIGQAKKGDMAFFYFDNKPQTLNQIWDAR